MSSLLLKGCLLTATMDDQQQELAGSDIAIRDGWIEAVGAGVQGEFDEVIDCSRFLAIPGLINTHHHLFQTLTRGFAAGDGRPLFEWLQTLYPVWAGLDDSMIYDSTRAGLAELALSGCTTCADHLYLFPPGSEDFIDRQVEAARDIGLRFHPTRGSMDLGQSQGGLPPDGVVQDRNTVIRDSERVIDTYHDSSPGSMLRIGLAPCSPFSVTPELMLESAGLARDEDVRLHTHIAETLDEAAFSQKNFNMTPMQLLGHLGWLGPDVWLAHSVHVDSTDTALLARHGASVAHCPTSNMLLASGLAPVRDYLNAGVHVGLGVDGSASNDANDLRQEVKQAMLAARTRDGVRALTSREALRMATRGGAECLGRDDIGSIQPGKQGDITLVDVSSLECSGGQEDRVSAAILGAPQIDTVIVRGRQVVRDGRLASHDKDEIAARQNESSRRLFEAWRAT
ncbi:MAG: 8-oxoguanine deaminase [Chloroflexota bacterium]